MALGAQELQGSVCSSALQLPLIAAGTGAGVESKPEGTGQVGAGHGSTDCWRFGLAHFALGRRIPDGGTWVRQPEQHSPVQHRVDVGQCFTGDPRAEEHSSAGISP